MTYSRREHIEAADAATRAMDDAKLAMDHAAWATPVLLVWALLYAADWAPQAAMIAAGIVWACWAVRAVYMLVWATGKARKLDRMNRGAP